VSLAVRVKTNTSNVSWSAFHANCYDPGSSTDLPTDTSLFEEDAATVAMISTRCHQESHRSH